MIGEDSDVTSAVDGSFCGVYYVVDVTDSAVKKSDVYGCSPSCGEYSHGAVAYVE